MGCYEADLADVQAYADAFTKHVVDHANQQLASVEPRLGTIKCDYDPFSDLPAAFFSGVRGGSSSSSARSCVEHALAFLLRCLDTCPANGKHAWYKAGQLITQSFQL